MTDTTAAPSVAARTSAADFWQTDRARRRRKARYAADFRLRLYGIAAISAAILLLGTLVTSLVATGYLGFIETRIAMTFDIDPELVDEADLRGSDWRGVVQQSISREFPDLAEENYRGVATMFTQPTPFIVRNRVMDDPSLVGRSVEMSIPASDIIDQLAKGRVDLDSPENRRRVTDFQARAFEVMQERGMISIVPNWGLFTDWDSRFPELAGLRNALVGSFYALLVCFLISFPMGVAAAVYLEEFAPKNRFTDIIEVNINNLAAVPSIVFGLLGLAVFLNVFGLPRSAPLVGGMVLSLMTLPTIIIVTRASLKAVPPSIREAALGVGASKHQMLWHHVLPLAMPGILTGTIIGLAQALGETAPLLLIGMNASIAGASGGLLEASTALPTQIYIWADSPERGFQALTSAGILVLLGFLIVMNGFAIFLRNRLERKW